MIYETEYLIEIDKELISNQEEERKPESVQVHDGEFKGSETKLY